MCESQICLNQIINDSSANLYQLEPIVPNMERFAKTPFQEEFSGVQSEKTGKGGIKMREKINRILEQMTDAELARVYELIQFVHIYK